MMSSGGFGLYGCWHLTPPYLLHCSIDLNIRLDDSCVKIYFKYVQSSIEWINS
jgi:hypothetical protein